MEKLEFSGGSVGQGSHVVTAVAWITAVRVGLIPGLGTSTCHGYSQKEKKNFFFK